MSRNDLHWIGDHPPIVFFDKEHIWSMDPTSFGIPDNHLVFSRQHLVHVSSFWDSLACPARKYLRRLRSFYTTNANGEVAEAALSQRLLTLRVPSRGGPWAAVGHTSELVGLSLSFIRPARALVGGLGNRFHDICVDTILCLWISYLDFMILRIPMN